MSVLPVSAQTWGTNPMLNHLQAARVNSLNEFIHRFNAEEIPDHIPLSDTTDIRKLCLAALFDINQLDSNSIPQAEEFIRRVLESNILLNLHDSNIYAETHCRFLYGKREVDINVVLQYDEVKPDIYRWAIVGANGLLEAGLIDTAYGGAISPVQNEVNFLELEQAFPHLYANTPPGTKIEQLSSLMALLSTKTLRYQFCKGITYHCYAVPGFHFTINQKNRLTGNSGWLITSVTNISNTPKILIKNLILGKQ